MREDDAQSQRLHVGIEALGVKHSGGAHVLRRLVAALLERDDLARLTLFVTPRPARRFTIPHEPRLRFVEVAWAEPATGRVAWLERGFERACAQHKIDVAVCFNGLGNAGKVTQVNIVQQPLMFAPEALATMPPRYRIRMHVIRTLSKLSCARADLVLAQTPTVRADLVSQFKLPADRVRVFTPDIDWLDAPMITEVAAKMRAAPPDARVLYIGSAMPYKSLDTVVEAIQRVRQEIRPATLFLSLPELHPFGFEPGVVCLGTLTHAEVRVALENATLLIMPSLSETLGLPLLEACAVGCPVLAADLPYAHDVCGSAARYFAPAQPRACARALRELLRDPKQRELLGQRGRERHEQLARAAPYANMVAAIFDAARRT